MPARHSPPGFASFVWRIVDLLRDRFSRSDYQKVILPFTLLRRLDCAEALPLPPQDSERQPPPRDGQGGFGALLADPARLAANLKNAAARLSGEFGEVLALFNIERTIDELEQAGLLKLVVQAFSRLDLSLASVGNHAMGTLFEEIVRTCVESSDEHPGEHFTPRDVIGLVSALLLAPDGKLGPPPGARSVYDPCCGTGGFLTGVAAHMEESGLLWPPDLYGQEINPVTYAICKADLLLLGRSGDAARIKLGNTLSEPAHYSQEGFDLLVCNPPFGLAWKSVQHIVEGEAGSTPGGGRFGAGLPRTSDGQLLFLQHLLSHARPAGHGTGSRIAIVLSASPLFTGEAGSGESQIRRYILERDLLEAIIALPESLFYNTSLGTYIWLLSTKKEPRRMGKVQLIDAREDFVSLHKSLGDRRRELAPEQIDQIVDRYLAGVEGPRSRVFAPGDFGYRKITVERPLRLNFQACPDRIALIERHRAFQALEQPRQRALISLLEGLPPGLFKNRAAFASVLQDAARRAGVGISSPLLKAVLAALSERDESAEICRSASGAPEPDPQLRDSENVPLGEDPLAFFAREVFPFWPDAWVNDAGRDGDDGKLGKVGYEINFTRAFFQYQPPRPLAEITAEILAFEREIAAQFQDLFGNVAE